MRKHILLFFLFGISMSLSAQNVKEVLFIGNSYTYFWNLSQTVEAMTADNDRVRLKTSHSTAGGANLGQHWRHEKKLKSKRLVDEGLYDYVVLQDHSMRSIDHPDSLMIYGKKFGKLIKASGGQAFLYMTWAREWNPYMQETITKKYVELAKSINARVVPVGIAWEQAKILRPNINLYDVDGSHPSPAGTYLTACVFYGILTGQSPVGLSPRVITTDKNGEPLYLNIQSKEDALFFQLVAEDVINNFPD